MKKLKFIIIGAILFSFVSIASLPSTTFADDSATTPPSPLNCEKKILTIPPWYRHLTEEKEGKCQIKSPTKPDGLSNFILTIALNLIEILFQSLGYVAFFVIILGGYFYITSNGDPAKMSRGISTIISAIIGVAIAIGASSAVRVVLNTVIVDSSDAEVFIRQVLNLIYSFAAITAVVVIVIAGIRMASSSGDPEKFAKAKNALLYAVIGVVVVSSAWALTDFVLDQLQPKTDSPPNG